MEEITVLDTLNYFASLGLPVSGLAIIALKNGWAPETVVEHDLYLSVEILDWKRKNGQR